MARVKTPKAKKGAWFVQTRWSYIPVSTMGALTYVPFLAFLTGSLWAVWQHTDNPLGALFDAFPYWVGAVVVMHWFASHKTGR